MPVNTRTMIDLKDEILSKIDDKFSEFKLDIFVELNHQLWCLEQLIMKPRMKCLIR